MRNINQAMDELWPRTYYSPIAMGLGDPAFLARNIVVDNWDAVWGKDSDKKIEDCTTYANTTEGDAKYPTGNTAKIRLNPTNDVIDSINDATNLNIKLYRDFGSSLSDTAYVMRRKNTYSDITLNTTGAQGFDTLIGMSSSTVAPNTAQDFLGIVFQNRSTGNTFRCVSFDGAALNGAITSQSPFAETPALQSYYTESIRGSATAFSSELFSDSAYLSSIEKESITVNSTIISLRYWNISLTSQTVTGSGAITETDDDMRVADGVTTPP